MSASEARKGPSPAPEHSPPAEGGSLASRSVGGPAKPLEEAPTVDDLARILDERGEKWDLYRLYNRRWAVALGDGRDDPSSRTVPKNADNDYGAETILEALRAAVASRRLPVIPRPPTLYGPHDLLIKKAGSRWEIRYSSGGFAGYSVTTKREAEEIRHRMITNSEARAREWAAEHADLINRGTEGVDYRWAL